MPIDYILENGIDTMLYKVGGKDFEEKPRREFTDDQVRTLRNMHKNERMSADEIAKRFGYSAIRINNLLEYKMYKNVI